MGKKLSYEHVKNFIESTGYSLLSNNYKNNSTKLLIRCDEGHIFKMIYNSFQNGRRCPICFGKPKHTYEYVKSFIENEGYTLLSDSYINSVIKLIVRCSEGHEYKVSFGNFQQGCRCPICAGVEKHSHHYVKNFIENEGYVLLSNSYKNNKEKLSLKCKYHHKFEMNFNSFQRGCRCFVCNVNKKSSKSEKDLQLFVESLGVSVIRNDRTQITNPLTGRNLELDVWIPELNKAIEFNGNYWHSFIEKILHDNIKKDQCKQKGIDLLIINDYDWLKNHEIEKSKIKDFINEVQ